MGGYTGKYSRNPFSTFDEEKNYAFSLLQEGVPITDDDWNENALMGLTLARRGNQLFGNYGTPNDGFRISEASANTNNFQISGGGPTNTDVELSGYFFMRGYKALLLHDVDYINNLSDRAKQSIHPRVTTVYYDGTNTIVEDSAANWVTDELKTSTSDRKIVIGGVTYDVDSNGTDYVKLLPASTDYTSAISAGDSYRLTLTTPSTNREDAVYLSMYVDEYDGNDDSSINKRIGGEMIEAMLRAKITQTLFVREDVPTNGEFDDYVDSDGNRHFVFKLATINRLSSNNTITDAMIVDHIPTIGFTTIGTDKISALRASPVSPADNVVNVESGFAINMARTSVVSWGGGNSPVFATQATNERWDLLYLKDDGMLDVLQGTGAVAPAPKPAIAGIEGTPIAYIRIDEPSDVNIDAADIVDARPFFGPDHYPRVKVAQPGVLNTIVTELNLQNYDTLILSPGTYTMTSSLTLSQTGLKILGTHESIINPTNWQLTLSGAYSIIDGIRWHITNTGTSYQGTLTLGGTHQRARNIYFSSASANNHYSLNISGSASFALVENCRFWSTCARASINSGATSGFAVIRDCEFSVYPIDASYERYGVIDIEAPVDRGRRTFVVRCRFEMNPYSARSVIGVCLLNQGTVRDCLFYSTQPDWTYDAYGISSFIGYSGTPGHDLTELIVDGCRFEGLTRPIWFDRDLDNSKISNCYIKTGTYAETAGIEVQYTAGVVPYLTDVVIEKCTIIANRNGIQIDQVNCNNFRIADNDIDVTVPGDLGGSSSWVAGIHFVGTGGSPTGNISITGNRINVSTDNDVSEYAYASGIAFNQSTGNPTFNGLVISFNRISVLGRSWTYGINLIHGTSYPSYSGVHIESNNIDMTMSSTGAGASPGSKGIYLAVATLAHVCNNHVRMSTSYDLTLVGLEMLSGSINSMVIGNYFYLSNVATTPAYHTSAIVLSNTDWAQVIGNRGHVGHNTGTGLRTGISFNSGCDRLILVGNHFTTLNNWLLGINNAATTTMGVGNIVAGAFTPASTTNMTGI